MSLTEEVVSAHTLEPFNDRVQNFKVEIIGTCV